ncbi:single-stranded DNA-binding protein [Candidatus Peregrinibacteria bacterium CG_4_9_14_0_2_um_filter_53_11]|nr:MAG: single-stranded DNA-binding protein [Candidatus Peregrinibacteria bacterium CG_4_9_14_0_2_um_filter_53_11]
MRSFNKVMLYGNLTSDPEVKMSKNSNNFTTFSIATNRDWKDKDGELVSETDFHRIVAFGRLGEVVARYLKKGAPILVAGRLSSRSYLNAEGEKRYATEVVLDDFNFIPHQRSNGTSPEDEEVREAVEAEQAEAVVEEVIASV